MKSVHGPELPHYGALAKFLSQISPETQLSQKIIVWDGDNSAFITHAYVLQEDFINVGHGAEPASGRKKFKPEQVVYKAGTVILCSDEMQLPEAWTLEPTTLEKELEALIARYSPAEIAPVLLKGAEASKKTPFKSLMQEAIEVADFYNKFPKSYGFTKAVENPVVKLSDLPQCEHDAGAKWKIRAFEDLRDYVPYFGKRVMTPDGPGILRNFYYSQEISEINGLLVEMPMRPKAGKKDFNLIVYNFIQVMVLPEVTHVWQCRPEQDAVKKDNREFPCDKCDTGEYIAGFTQPNGQVPYTCNECGHAVSYP